MPSKIPWHNIVINAFVSNMYESLRIRMMKEKQMGIHFSDVIHLSACSFLQ